MLFTQFLWQLFRNLFLVIGLVTICFGAEKSDKYSAESIANLFYQLNGDTKNPHKKVNHTKGFCASGEFVPSDGITKILDIPLLANKSIKAQMRYSLGGGNENASDKSKSRGLAIKMQNSNDAWEIVALNTEINFAKNAKEFYEFFALRVPQNGKINTQRLMQETKKVASYRNYETYMQSIGISPSVAHTSYHSIHTFFAKSKQKEILPVKFKFVPLLGEVVLNDDELAKKSDNFLHSDFKSRIKKGAISYKMVAIIANKGDVIDDTTSLWSNRHREIEIGLLNVRKLESDKCNSEVFMPNILPQGISEPKDKLFDVRNEVYAITFSRRQQ